ncbi:hypothetical protein MMC10_009286 [Thelotrema lepadinum]|nr:hypothetical protein [Thelotrema lepadinum]
MYFPQSCITFLALSAAVVTASPFNARQSAPPTQTHSSEFITLGCPNTTSAVASASEQLETARTFINLFLIQKDVAQAFDTYVAADAINHANFVAGDGRDLAVSTITPQIDANTFDIKWITVGDGYANTLFEATGSQGSVAAIEVFRMVGTCFVEHWIVQQAVMNSSNPHPYF